MKKRVLSAFLLLTFVFVLSACSSQSGGNTTPSGGGGSSGNTVSIENFSFNPSVLTVTVGTTVVWTNNDTAVHTIKSATFNSKDLSKGDTFEYKFDKAGTYDYSCGIHPTMTGRIIVTESGSQGGY